MASESGQTTESDATDPAIEAAVTARVAALRRALSDEPEPESLGDFAKRVNSVFRPGQPT